MENFWKFLVTSLLTAFFSSPLQANPVYGEVSHSISVPSSGNIFSTTTINWQPLPQFSGLQFSYVKLGTKSPEGNWTYKNTSLNNYTFKPETVGLWCFKVRAWHEGTFGLFTSEKCMNVNNQIGQFVTHTIQVPQSARVGENVAISWLANADFSDTDFNYYKLGTQTPSGNWSYENLGSLSKTVKVSGEGKWCFKVRAKYEDDFGLFSSTKCVDVSDSIYGVVTHEVVPPSDVVETEEMTVRWNTVPEYSDLNFSYVKLYVTRPNDTRFDVNIHTGNTYQFTPEATGDWCFQARAYYDTFSLYGQKECASVLHKNMFLDGNFSQVPGGSSPWNDHDSFHIGSWSATQVNGSNAISFTSPVKQDQLNTPAAGFDNYEEFYDACLDPSLSPSLQTFRCIKSEISFTASSLETPNDASVGQTNWIGYEFTVDRLFDLSECANEWYNSCYVFISQFHTGSLANLSPNNAILLQYNKAFDNIVLTANTKVDCKNSQVSDSMYCSDSDAQARGYSQVLYGQYAGITEGLTYKLLMRIDWSTGLTGSASVYIKGPNQGDFVLFGENLSVQTTPKTSPLNFQTGLYWGGLNKSRLYNNGDNGSPMKVTTDNYWWVRDVCHLPSDFRPSDQSFHCD